MLFQEVMEWTLPSQTMNKAVFSKYIQMKGVGENIDHFHYTVSRNYGVDPTLVRL